MDNRLGRRQSQKEIEYQEREDAEQGLDVGSLAHVVLKGFS